MENKVVIAAGMCPKCGEQLTPTTHGNFCLMCGYTQYGDGRTAMRISQRDVKEITNGKKRNV